VELPQPLTFEVSHPADVGAVRRAAQSMVAVLGFSSPAGDEIVVAARELAANLVKHAQQGRLTLTPITEAGHSGIQIESRDEGPGIADVEWAVTDGVSTAGGLGLGLGAVNRLMDEFDITSEPGRGTTIMCRRWLRASAPSGWPCPLDVGVATRPHPGEAVNGDAFVVRHWQASLLVGIIDGLGHGPLAHLAAETARQYVESHFDQPLADIFRGTGRACRATRGVVMALARFDWAIEQLTFASVGNVEARVFGTLEARNFLVRRGVIGLNAPGPAVTEHRWLPDYVLVLASDGLKTNWGQEDSPDLEREPASVGAQKVLRALARDTDDTTVIVVKGLCSSH
jgi:anti-sigma regulatory factor (Ser/Thr protein kinase)